MFLPLEQYVVLSTDRQNYVVVAEATTRAESEDYIRAKRLAECLVLKEDGEEIYRVLCKQYLTGDGQ